MTGTTMITSARDRIASLDVIRGVAVMGIFSVNIIAFAMVFSAYFNPSAFGGYHGENLAVWLANYVLVDGKMRTLFSMLFGASMLLVIERAEASGQSGAAVHYRRMIVLLLFGLIHFYVIWHGDILVLYALTGIVAFLFRRQQAKTMLIWAASLLAVTTLMFGYGATRMYRADIAAHAPSATAKDIKRWNDGVGFLVNIPAQSAEETQLARGPLPERVEHMVEQRGAEPFTSMIPLGFPTLGLMLIGMAAYRSGFLTGAWDRRRYRRIALWGLGLGGGATLALGLWVIQSHFYVPLIFFAFLVIGTPFQVAMALGYAALIILLSRTGGWLSARFAAVGRTAFTNYLGTSILAAVIFYGDGLALFGRLSRAQAWLFVPLFWLIMLAWSKPWLDRFQYGPLEWLWRSLARLEFQPLRKSSPPF